MNQNAVKGTKTSPGKGLAAQQGPGQTGLLQFAALIIAAARLLACGGSLARGERGICLIVILDVMGQPASQIRAHVRRAVNSSVAEGGREIHQRSDQVIMVPFVKNKSGKAAALHEGFFMLKMGMSCFNQPIEQLDKLLDIKKSLIDGRRKEMADLRRGSIYPPNQKPVFF